MSDNKTILTDAEIKKALEIYIEQLCRGCKVEKTICCPVCISTLISQSLDYTNRLEAEREALIAGQETLQKALSDKNAEIERLNIYIEQYKKSIEGLKTITKAEAIKEVVNRFESEIKALDKDIRKFNDSKDKTYCNALKAALKILKEMAGDAG